MHDVTREQGGGGGGRERTHDSRERGRGACRVHERPRHQRQVEHHDIFSHSRSTFSFHHLTTPQPLSRSRSTLSLRQLTTSPPHLSLSLPPYLSLSSLTSPSPPPSPSYIQGQLRQNVRKKRRRPIQARHDNQGLLRRVPVTTIRDEIFGRRRSFSRLYMPVSCLRFNRTCEVVRRESGGVGTVTSRAFG